MRFAVLGRLRAVEQCREAGRIDELAIGQIDHQWSIDVLRRARQQLAYLGAGGDVELTIDRDDPHSVEHPLGCLEAVPVQDHSWSREPGLPVHRSSCLWPLVAVPVCPDVEQQTHPSGQPAALPSQSSTPGSVKRFLRDDGRYWARTKASRHGERWRWFVPGVTWMGATGLEPVTSSLSSWRSPN